MRLKDNTTEIKAIGVFVKGEDVVEQKAMAEVEKPDPINESEVIKQNVVETPQHKSEAEKSWKDFKTEQEKHKKNHKKIKSEEV